MADNNFNDLIGAVNPFAASDFKKKYLSEPANVPKIVSSNVDNNTIQDITSQNNKPELPPEQKAAVQEYLKQVTPTSTPATTPTPSTVPKAAAEPKLRPVNQTKFATPSPKVATTKEELAKLKTDIQNLEKQTGLNLLPYLFGGELARIKHQFTDLNINKYYLLLCLLVYGFDNNIMSATIGENNPKYVIDDNFIKDFQRMIKIPQLTDILKKTPAFAKGCFEEMGQFGNMAAGGDMMDNNPITGPNRYTPSLVTNTMEKIWPGSVNKLEKFCNMIRTRAYLTMPKSAFGSIQKVVRLINGVVKAFNKMMNDFYKLMM